MSLGTGSGAGGNGPLLQGRGNKPVNSSKKKVEWE